MNKKPILYLILAVVLLGLGPACASKSTLKSSAASLVGVWVEQSEVYSYRSITIRKSDGTFQDVVGRASETNEPKETLRTSGLWWLKPKTYVFKTLKSSKTEFKFINKKILLEIIYISGDTFKYWSTDGAQVTETKVAEASPVAFNAEVERMFGEKQSQQ